MKSLTYTMSIGCPPQRVWDAMVDPGRYREWAKAFSPNSQFEGDWTEGSFVTFFDPDIGGTKAVVEEVVAPSRLHAKHIAIVNKDGTEDTESDDARKWIGVTETYTLVDSGDSTDLLVEINTHEDYVEMFEKCWPEALRLLKQACEGE